MQARELQKINIAKYPEIKKIMDKKIKRLNKYREEKNLFPITSDDYFLLEP
jgi:hypothetical protein